MKKNALWQQAVSINGLEAGWHLARAELRAGFFYDFFHQQAVAQNLQAQLKEVKRLLDTRTYRFRPLRQVLIPKGPLSTRPGSHLPLRDRVIFWSIVKQIAPVFDALLSRDVYSYRLKENPKKGELFKEGDALSLPFLKTSQIKAELDPFEPWYGAWPDFEERTKAEIGEGYDHMVISDIAGYFENINIEILKDQIMATLHHEPILANFVAEGLSEWVNPSQIGHRPKRSIPQGTGISSFFGNIYLVPIDEHFAAMQKESDLKYIRYMDDIRIFTKDAATARRCIFELEKSVRELHLSLQSAKTKIIRETKSDKQISHSLFDDRLEAITSLRSAVDKVEVTEDDARLHLRKIARRDPLNPRSSKLLGVKHPASDLTDRAMRAWMNLSIRLGETEFIPTLLRQIKTNPDQRLSRIFVNTCRTFPRHSKLGSAAADFIFSDNNIHQHQEAELIKGCRYLSSVPDAIWKRALENCLTRKVDFQLKVQSLILLGMRSHSKDIYRKFLLRMHADDDIIAQPYYFSVLGQIERDERFQLVRDFIWHANQHNQEFGLLLRKLETDFATSKRFLDHVFGSDTEIIDWQGVLFHLAEAREEKVQKYLLNSLRYRLKQGGRVQLRARLAAIKNRIPQ